MKRFLLAVGALVAAMALASSCSYDDTAIKNDIEQIKEDLTALTERVAALEQKLQDEYDALSRAEEEGRLPVIIGTPTHPEVEGIAGWCSHCKIFENVEELQKWAESGEIPMDLPISMVCQTTSTEALWNFCKIFANLFCKLCKIFTIFLQKLAICTNLSLFLQFLQIDCKSICKSPIIAQ